MQPRALRGSGDLVTRGSRQRGRLRADGRLELLDAPAGLQEGIYLGLHLLAPLVPRSARPYRDGLAFLPWFAGVDLWSEAGNRRVALPALLRSDFPKVSGFRFRFRRLQMT